MSQISFASAEFSRKKKTTRREKFLGYMERVEPWARLIATGGPNYPTSGRRGRPLVGLERMPRMVFVQQWYGLADGALEDAVFDSQVLCDFIGSDLAHLAEHGLLMRVGTIVDARIIAAPASTKSQKKERDPEMHQAKKGKQCHFGLKAHIGADAKPGLVHSVIGTAANVSDGTQAQTLLHGDISTAEWRRSPSFLADAATKSQFGRRTPTKLNH